MVRAGAKRCFVPTMVDASGGTDVHGYLAQSCLDGKLEWLQQFPVWHRRRSKSRRDALFLARNISLTEEFCRNDLLVWNRTLPWSLCIICWSFLGTARSYGALTTFLFYQWHHCNQSHPFIFQYQRHLSSGIATLEFAGVGSITARAD